MLRPLVALLLMVLAVAALPAQQNRQYFFTHYGKRDGLAANDAASVVQDDKGFIWIATINGLQRFDGARFLTFAHRADNLYRMPANHVVQLHIDRQKRLWLVFGNGVIGQFDTRKFLFHEVKVLATDLPALRAGRRLSEDHAGNMLLHVPGTFYKYDSGSDQFRVETELIGAPRGWFVYDFIPDPDKIHYWLGCDSGLAVYNRVTRSISYRNHNVENIPAIYAAGRLRYTSRTFLDSKGRLWFKCWPKGAEQETIFFVDTRSARPALNECPMRDPPEGYHSTYIFFETKDGIIWSRGAMTLAEFDEQSRAFQPVINETTYGGIGFERINDLYEDREKNIWVATNNNGVYRFNPSAEIFQTIAHYAPNRSRLGDGHVISFMHMRDGSILAGTSGDGLYRYGKDFNNIPLNLPAGMDSLPVHVMMRSRNGHTIWMGAQRGVFIYDEAKNKAVYHNPAIFDNRLVNRIVEDKFGNIWFSTMNTGLYKWTAGRQRAFPDGLLRITAIPDFRITGIVADPDGFLWVGTQGGGVYKMDPETNNILLQLTNGSPPHQQLLMDDIASMMLLNDSTLLMAAGGLNIYNFRKGAMQHLTLADGLPSQYMIAMEKDRSGMVWLAQFNGICRADLQRRSFTYFDREQGMRNDVFNHWASYSLPDGRLLFGTANSFLVFDPQKTTDSTRRINIEFTGLSVANKPLPLDSLLRKDIITLGPNENSLVIEFAELSFLHNYKCSYRLENLDDEWRTADELNRAIYSYLPPGSYAFTVKAEDDKGAVGESATLRIKVVPPFWRTWWFYGLVVLTVACIWWWIDQEKMAKRKAILDMRTQIAGDLHHEISNTLNNIYMLSEMARIKADRNAPLSKEYIGQIHDKSKSMITVMDDILWSITPENDSMDKFLWRMRELAEALKHENKAAIDIHIDDNVKGLRLDMKHRLLFFLIFKEALYTVIVLAQGRNTAIAIDLLKGALSFRLHDETAAFDAGNEDMGKRIQSMQDRARQLDADLDFVTNNQGITIMLHSPVK